MSGLNTSQASHRWLPRASEIVGEFRYTPLVLILLLAAANLHSFLFFHLLAELVTVIVAVTAFLVAWNTYPFSRNNFLMFLGCGYFWAGVLHLFHALMYKGMGLTPHAGANVATQLWIAARYVEAFVLVTAPLFLVRPLPRTGWFALFGFMTATLITLVFTGRFPDAYVEGSGLTTFKVTSEYAVIAMLVGAATFLWHRRALLDRRMLVLILASISLTVAAELAFTFYVGVYDLANVIGHFLKFFAFWLVYVALVEFTLKEPFRALARTASTYDAVPDPILVVDRETVVRGLNKAAALAAGLPPERVLGRPCHELFHPQSFTSQGCPVCSAIRRGESLAGLDLRFPVTGSRFEITLSPVTAAGGAVGMVHAAHDVTVRANAQERAHLSELKFRTLFNSARDAIVILSPEGRFIDANAATVGRLGYSVEELRSMTVRDIDTPEFAALAETRAAQIQRDGYALFEAAHVTRDGRVIPIEVSGRYFEYEGSPAVLSVWRDISERKRSESELRKVNRALKTLSSGNEVLVRTNSEPELLHEMCRVIAETGGYRMAWVGYVEHDDARTVRPVARSGFEAGYLDQVRISWSDTDHGRGPVGAAIRTGSPQVVRNGADSAYAPWMGAALERGYVSMIALPLLDADGQAFGALAIYAGEPDAFDEEEMRLLGELAGDLAYGIVNLRTRAEHREHTERLRESLEETIQVIATTVEVRDPYTAGHQKRVAGLAEAIARELGLTDDRVHGLRLAGIVHDLGKLSIPSEILSKPGRLTPIEYELIKTHAKSGYEILKDVSFPWPIAQMVLQHHERLDGSGYPNQAKGDDIILEARVLAVADVVEAMSSNRPYRPGLGLDVALDEIRRERGVKYDPAVVDACLTLFLERRFAFAFS
jgi:PAS domain S-box-containing protein/putative nucleotidyltransferase with HDIG domain